MPIRGVCKEDLNNISLVEAIPEETKVGTKVLVPNENSNNLYNFINVLSLTFLITAKLAFHMAFLHWYIGLINLEENGKAHAQ